MKWFTYCGNKSTERKSSSYGGGYTTHNKRRWEPRGNQALGLLLHSDDENDRITDADVQAFIQHETIRELFPNGVMSLPGQLENDVIVTASTSYTLLPDKATIDTPKLRILYDNELQELDLRHRYNGCKSLIKAIGCHNCDDKGMRCLRQSLQGELPDHFDRSKDEDDVKELFVNRKTKIGAFTFISPRLTIPERHFFVPSMRHYEDHDFGMIQTNSDAISANNTERAEYLRFKKQQCSRCPLQKHCHAYRSCAGPYPPEAEIAKQLIEDQLPSLNGAGFKEWQFWAVARSGNFRTKYKRYEVAIHGMEKSYRGWRAVIFRTKTSLRRITEIDNYDELRRLFPNLPDEETAKARPQYWGRPENDVATALYLRLTDFTESARTFSAGWGRTSYGILAKRLNDDHVRVTYCGPRYERHDSDMTNFGQFFDQITHRIGVSQIRVRDGETPYN